MTFDENAYYDNHYQCTVDINAWTDQYGNRITYTCQCSGKTIPQFDVTHALVTAQCQECYKFHGQSSV